MPNVGDIIKASDLQDLLNQINANSSNIVGELKYFGFNEVPEHCLMCDGSEISRETYHELFEKYGTTYGEGDGLTTFNLPDYRGAFFRCIGGNADSIGVLQESTILGLYCMGSNSSTIAIVMRNIDKYINNAINISNLYNYKPASYVRSTTAEGYAIRPTNYSVNVCVIYE